MALNYTVIHIISIHTYRILSFLHKNGKKEHYSLDNNMKWVFNNYLAKEKNTDRMEVITIRSASPICSSQWEDNLKERNVTKINLKLPTPVSICLIKQYFHFNPILFPSGQKTVFITRCLPNSNIKPIVMRVTSRRSHLCLEMLPALAAKD